MKKIYLATVLLFSLMATGTVLSQENHGVEPTVVSDIGVTEFTPIELPNPGILPGSFWYFLDGWGETIVNVFTFNHERKAILQTERTLERVSEVSAILEKKGVDAPELDSVNAKIQQHIETANESLKRQKLRGIEVPELAKRIETDFNTHRKMLNRVFDYRRESLAKRASDVRNELKQTRAAEDLDGVSGLRTTLGEIKRERDALAQKRDVFHSSIISKNEKVREKMTEEARNLSILKLERETLVDEGKRAIERVFEEREIKIEAQEEVLETQLNKAILAGDIEAIKTIYNNLRAIELQTNALEVEEYLFKEKVKTEEGEPAPPISIILETREDIDDLRTMAIKAKTHAKELITKALSKIEVQNMHDNSAIIGLVEQATRFHERGLMLFDKGEYKKSYLSSRKAMDFAGKTIKLITVKEQLRKGIHDTALVVPDVQDTPHIVSPPEIVETDTPALVDTPTPDKTLKELSTKKIKQQLEKAEHFIEKTRAIVHHKSVDVLAFPVIIRLLEEAEQNITKAEALLEQGIYDKEKYAISALSLANKAYKITKEKLQSGEIKITSEPTKKPISPPNKTEALNCKIDADCKDLICIMLIGSDTPRCNTATGKCFCGSGDNLDNSGDLISQ